MFPFTPNLFRQTIELFGYACAYWDIVKQTILNNFLHVALCSPGLLPWRTSFILLQVCSTLSFPWHNLTSTKQSKHRLSWTRPTLQLCRGCWKRCSQILSHLLPLPVFWSMHGGWNAEQFSVCVWRFYVQKKLFWLIWNFRNQFICWVKD